MTTSEAATVNTGEGYVIITGQTYDGVGHWLRDARPTAILKPGDVVPHLVIEENVRRYLIETGPPPPV